MSGDSVQSDDLSPGSLGGRWLSGELVRDGGRLLFGWGEGLGVDFTVVTVEKAKTVFGRSAESSIDSGGLCQNNVINLSFHHIWLTTTITRTQMQKCTIAWTMPFAKKGNQYLARQNM